MVEAAPQKKPSPDTTIIGSTHRQVEAKLAKLLPKLKPGNDFIVSYVDSDAVHIAVDSETAREAIVALFPTATSEDMMSPKRNFVVSREVFDDKTRSPEMTNAMARFREAKQAVHACLKDEAVKNLTQVTVNETGGEPMVELRINTQDPGQWRNVAAAWRAQLPLSKREKAGIPDKPNDNFVLTVPLDKVKGWSAEPEKAAGNEPAR